jgi:hypothetical protein
MYRAPASIMTSVLLVLAIILLVRERTETAIVYLGLAVNLLFLLLALGLNDGRASYLGDDSFLPYYSKAMLVETLFWVFFGSTLELRSRATGPYCAGGPHIKLGFPLQNLQLLAIVILAVEIALSHRQYFTQYLDASDTGTILYEVGCLLVAVGVMERSARPRGRIFQVLEAAGTGLALFIALGSGKRLPLSFVILAYMLVFLRRYGKWRTVLTFLAVSGVGYLFGILRDSMALGDINLATITAGFQATNQGAVLHASSVYLRIADEGLSTVLDRGISFLSNVFGTMLLPMSWLPEQAQVNVHAMRFYPVQGNGGFIGCYAFFFMGWVGPALVGTAMAWLCSSRGRRWTGMAALLFLLTSPRWMLYNLGPVVRLLSMTMVLFAAIGLISSPAEREAGQPESSN